MSTKTVVKKKAAAPKKKPANLATIFKSAESYIGLKKIQAVPMTRGSYNECRGWDLPVGENPKDAGYIVRYQDGYVSWTPLKQFAEAYQPTNKLSFSAAVYLMKQGKKLARAGWNGKGMWVIYVPGTKKVQLKAGTPYANHLSKRKTVDILPHFDMWTVNSDNRRAMLPGWLASQSDIDADDWTVVK